MDTAPKLLVPSLITRPCVRPCPLLTHQIRFGTSEPWQHIVMWTQKQRRRSVREAELQKGVCESQLTELFGECEATGDQCLPGVDPACESSAVRSCAWTNAVVQLLFFGEEKTSDISTRAVDGNMLAYVKLCLEARRSAFGMFVLRERSACGLKRYAAALGMKYLCLFCSVAAKLFF